MRIGIVGNGYDKFTNYGADYACDLIEELVSSAATVLSGHSPVGGVDIWAEEIAEELGVSTDIKIPKVQRWDGGYGYKARNLDIARESDIVHVVLADTYPEEYSGRRFKVCYHCPKRDSEYCDVPWHVKSGGCWTGVQAVKAGNKAVWHVIPNTEGGKEFDWEIST